MPRRASPTQRERASLELRAWAKSGALGMGDVAWAARQRAALRLGFPSVLAASEAGCSVDVFSEAIEDVESAT